MNSLTTWLAVDPNHVIFSVWLVFTSHLNSQTTCLKVKLTL